MAAKLSILRRVAKPQSDATVELGPKFFFKTACAGCRLWLFSTLGVISSVGRALRLHRRCQEFESLITHHEIPLNYCFKIKHIICDLVRILVRFG
jgi:hypothetical protein